MEEQVTAFADMSRAGARRPSSLRLADVRSGQALSVAKYPYDATPLTPLKETHFLDAESAAKPLMFKWLRNRHAAAVVGAVLIAALGNVNSFDLLSVPGWIPGALVDGFFEGFPHGGENLYVFVTIFNFFIYYGLLKPILFLLYRPRRTGAMRLPAR